MDRRPPLGFLRWKLYTDIDGTDQQDQEDGDFMVVNRRDGRMRLCIPKVTVGVWAWRNRQITALFQKLSRAI